MDIISIFRNLELEFAVYYISKTGKYFMICLFFW